MLKLKHDLQSFCSAESQPVTEATERSVWFWSSKVDWLLYCYGWLWTFVEENAWNYKKTLTLNDHQYAIYPLVNKHNYGLNHHFQWENFLELYIFNSYFDIIRGYTSADPGFGIREKLCRGTPSAPWRLRSVPWLPQWYHRDFFWNIVKREIYIYIHRNMYKY